MRNSSLGCGMNFRWTMMYFLGDPHVVKEITAEVRRSYIWKYPWTVFRISRHFGSRISLSYSNVSQRFVRSQNFYFLSASSYPMHIVSKVYTVTESLSKKKSRLDLGGHVPVGTCCWHVAMLLWQQQGVLKWVKSNRWVRSSMSASGAARRPNGERVKTAFFFGICLWKGLFGVMNSLEDKDS